MKKIILFLGFFFAIVANAQDFVGKWNGTAVFMGQEFKMFFDIEKKDNVYSATISSGDQSSKPPVQVSKITIEKDKIILRVESMNITYTGILEKENVMKGTYKQHAFEFPLNLTREN